MVLKGVHAQTNFMYEVDGQLIGPGSGTHDLLEYGGTGTGRAQIELAAKTQAQLQAAREAQAREAQATVLPKETDGAGPSTSAAAPPASSVPPPSAALLPGAQKIDLGKLRAELNLVPLDPSTAAAARTRARGGRKQGVRMARMPRAGNEVSLPAPRARSTPAGRSTRDRGSSEGRSRSRSKGTGRGGESGDSESGWGSESDDTSSDSSIDWSDRAGPAARRITRGLEAQYAGAALRRRMERDGYDGWADPSEECVYCGEDDFQPDFGPRTFIYCSCCSRFGTHVACESAVSRVPLTERHVTGQAPWYCSAECRVVQEGFDGLLGVTRACPVQGPEGSKARTLEIVTVRERIEKFNMHVKELCERSCRTEFIWHWH